MSKKMKRKNRKLKKKSKEKKEYEEKLRKYPGRILDGTSSDGAAIT